MKRLIWIALGLFTLEVVGILAGYWFSGGHAMGDLTLTISKYVGLAPWSMAVFGVVNTIIGILVTYYALLSVKKANPIWRFLMLIFVICFFGLSLCPHLPDMTAQITHLHQVFARTMFVVMALVGILMLMLEQKPLKRLACMGFIVLATFVIVGYVTQWPVVMNAILIFETAYIYWFFVIVAGYKPALD